ncbi:TIGR01906 family membrane protein [Clostridium gasigenes]|uniref:TIGR01906 family membrane protein n=1 Tax=Clostridium gasigenes TaxID=94869 RepID=UPI001C0AAF90|nr:TIGR01906 family membrane protein [Clostridium gasigenes]MBU3103766.1 TIGR01906 family membrane protein [Clostridium gasigenes]MBU3132894.1 TIGR01906 family membrane protein [Clostridium gasigenes]MBU3136662.1 TIGR01906 family membrane protein [Clostridium gasigenes]
MLIESKKNISKFINIILGLCITLFSICFSVILVLNLTFIYKVSIEKFNLVKDTGVSAENLMINYKSMINYIRNPFIEELKFKDFAMSSSGQIHFEEVKDIFMNLYIMMFISMVILILFKVIKKVLVNISLIKALNYSSNMIFILFGVITTMIVVDFSKTFVIFHNIFFDNSYWIFDPITDPIINALPEMVFMIYALIIIMFLLVEAILFKVIYYKKR